MLIASLIAGIHFSAIIAMVVFQTSQSAICRPEWFNSAVLARLLRVNKIYLGCLAVTWLSGILQLLYGAHGILTGVYFLQHNWIVVVKIMLFATVTYLSIKASKVFNNWQHNYQQHNTLPDTKQINRQRYLVLIEAHIILFMPFLGAFLTNGYGFIG